MPAPYVLVGTRLYQAGADSVPHGEHRVLERARHSPLTTDCPNAAMNANVIAASPAWRRLLERCSRGPGS